MNLRPFFSAKDLAQVFHINERTARRRIAFIIEKVQRRNKGAASFKNPGGSRPHLVYADEVTFQFGLTRDMVQTYIDNQLNTSLYDLIDERDLKRMLDGRWINRNIWFSDKNHNQICVQRIGLFPLYEGISDINPKMNRITSTIFPVQLLYYLTNADLENCLRRVN